jgi:hypothetical protein
VEIPQPEPHDGSASGVPGNRDRVAQLEQEVSQLQNEVADLKREFSAFRKQFES